MNNYDELSVLVNKSYKRTDDIRLTMKELNLPFDDVWDMLGFKDYYDFVETDDGKDKNHVPRHS